jgi:hypothetical protein
MEPAISYVQKSWQCLSSRFNGILRSEAVDFHPEVTRVAA